MFGGGAARARSMRKALSSPVFLAFLLFALFPLPAIGVPPAGVSVACKAAQDGVAGMCGDEPAAARRPAPTTPAKGRSREQLLAFFKGLSSRTSKKLLSGQRVDRLEGPKALAEFRRISDATGGVLPAIMGCDFSIGDDAKPYESFEPLVGHWNAGGLVHFTWHAANPSNGNVWKWHLREPRFERLSDVYTPGNPIYDNFRFQMTRVGDQVRLLEERGVVITFAPFHEANNHNPVPSFWWDGRPAREYRALWRYLHDYLVVERGLSNIVWVFAATRFYDVVEYYPGDEYVDVVGLDYYPVDGRVDGYDAVNAHALSWYDTLRSTFPGKPFAFTELGVCTLPDGNTNARSDAACSGQDARSIVNDISTYFPEAVWWMNWDDEHHDYGLGNQRRVLELLGDPRVIVLSDNPSGAGGAQEAGESTAPAPGSSTNVPRGIDSGWMESRTGGSWP